MGLRGDDGATAPIRMALQAWKTSCGTRCAADQTDVLVYELYGLTDAEIRIVEEATRSSLSGPTGRGRIAGANGPGRRAPRCL